MEAGTDHEQVLCFQHASILFLRRRGERGGNAEKGKSIGGEAGNQGIRITVEGAFEFIGRRAGERRAQRICREYIMAICCWLDRESQARSQRP